MVARSKHQEFNYNDSRFYLHLYEFLLDLNNREKPISIIKTLMSKRKDLVSWQQLDQLFCQQVNQGQTIIHLLLRANHGNIAKILIDTYDDMNFLYLQNMETYQSNKSTKVDRENAFNVMNFIIESEMNINQDTSNFPLDIKKLLYQFPKTISEQKEITCFLLKYAQEKKGNKELIISQMKNSKLKSAIHWGLFLSFKIEVPNNCLAGNNKPFDLHIQVGNEYFFNNGCSICHEEVTSDNASDNASDNDCLAVFNCRHVIHFKCAENLYKSDLGKKLGCPLCKNGDQAKIAVIPWNVTSGNNKDNNCQLPLS